MKIETVMEISTEALEKAGYSISDYSEGYRVPLYPIVKNLHS